MLSFSLTSFFLFAVAESALASLKRLDSVANRCQISLDNYHFNLCPLLNEQRNPGQVDLVFRRETLPTITTIVYNISLNGPLPISDAIPDDEQCIDGTWACVTMREDHLGRDLGNTDHRVQVIPIVIEAPQSEPRRAPSAKVRENFGIYVELRDSVEDASPSLSVHMHGSHHGYVPQRIQIDFECTESDDDKPKLSKVWNNTHIFTWTTKHACAQLYHTSLEDEGETDRPAEDEAPEDPPPEDAEEPSPNQDLLFPPVSPDKTGPSITTVLVCSGAVLLGIGYLVIRPPAQLRKHVRAIRRARFLRGIGETKLLHWAAEEFEMLRDDEFEADEMVNSRPLPDEEIPLRTSRTQPTYTSYGTAH